MKNRIVQTIILLLLLAGMGYVIVNNVFGSKSIVKAGSVAPNFTLQTLADDALSLSDFQGKGIVLNFWATYCQPCLAEMPALQRQYERYKEQGIVVLGVNTGESAATVSGYIRRLEVNYPIVLDPGYQVVKQYQVGPIPHTLFIYPDGKVKNIIIGEMTEDMIEKNMRELLSLSNN